MSELDDRDPCKGCKSMGGICCPCAMVERDDDDDEEAHE
jgi:hypothetical protein